MDENMLETISLIVSVAAGVLSSLDVVKNVQGIKRAKASFFLEEIATTIDEVVTKFKNNEVPHGACMRMRQYSLHFVDTLEGLIDTEQLISYSNMLYYAHELELLYKDVQDDNNKLVELEKAAGMFRAAAMLAKI